MYNKSDLEDVCSMGRGYFCIKVRSVDTSEAGCPVGIRYGGESKAYLLGGSVRSTRVAIR